MLLLEMQTDKNGKVIRLRTVGRVEYDWSDWETRLLPSGIVQLGTTNTEADFVEKGQYRIDADTLRITLESEVSVLIKINPHLSSCNSCNVFASLFDIELKDRGYERRMSES